MTFLQPLMLAALPLVGLPIIIHLINQRRFQTVPWAAMMFLESARALSRGYSRLRHWLIMALRMLAVAAVILAVGRPLSRGWLALAGGGRPDTAIVILDRSPSMQQRRAAATETKLETGRRQLAESLSTLGASRCVLITDASRSPLELEKPAAIADLPGAGPAATAADMPLLLQAAYDHVRENAAGTTEVWICSDQRSNDWALESGSWPSLRDGFAKLPQQVRFQLLSYAEPAEANLAVRVTATRVERRADGRELLVDVAVNRQEEGERTVVPLRFEIGGGSSTVDLELTGREAELKNHPIPLDRSAGPRGWGRVSIPSDSNAADNEFYFVFDEPVARKSIVVAEDATARRWLALLAEIPPEKEQTSTTEAVAPDEFSGLPLDEAALVLWQGPLPDGKDAEPLEAFVARGGQVIFFPPEAPTDRSFAGVKWTEWKTHPRPVKPVSWRRDGDLLANTAAGTALPVGELDVFRSCDLAGDLVPLASLPESAVLLGRVAEDRGGGAGGGIVFCTTTPNARNSTLASEGVVLYAAVQRAIDRGLAGLGTARQVVAGEALAKIAGGKTAWERLAGPTDPLTSETGLHAGVFTAEGRLVAVNRPAAEDAGRIAADERIDGLFRDLAYSRIAGRAGDADSLVQEIWRAFLITMAVALVAEALLCWPKSPAAGKSPLSRVRPLEAAA
jgi:hypothetical protein